MIWLLVILIARFPVSRIGEDPPTPATASVVATVYVDVVRIVGRYPSGFP